VRHGIEALALGFLRDPQADRQVDDLERHGRHDAGFFELAGELPVVVTLFVEAPMADQLLQPIAEAGLSLPYAKLLAEIGITA